MARTKKSEIYNHEGYTDTTAFFGMYGANGEEKKTTITRDLRRGEIYYIAPEGGATEENKSRPGIIVSTDQANRYSSSIEVVFLTEREQTRNLPSYVTIHGTGRTSTALCGKIHCVAVERVGEYIASVTAGEQKEINRALLYALELTGEAAAPAAQTLREPQRKEPAAPDKAEEPGKMAAEYAKAVVERDLYKSLYNKLFDEIMTRTYSK